MNEKNSPLPGAFAGNSFPQKILENLLSELQKIDTKAIGVFGIISIIVSFLVNFLDKTSSLGELNIRIWSNILYISVIIVALNIYSIIRVIYPRTGKGNKEGMIYFKDIIKNNNQEYVTKGIKLTDLDITKLQYSQSHIIAGIVNRKYRWLQYSIISTLITLIWVVFIILKF